MINKKILMKINKIGNFTEEYFSFWENYLNTQSGFL